MDSFLNKTSYNSCQFGQKVLFNNLVLPVDNNDKIDITYSSLDKVTINTALDTAFSTDIYGRQVCSVITDFLGYSSYDGVNARFKTFISKCNDLFNESNK